MDIQHIRQLIRLVERSGIAELEIREGESTIRIAKPEAPAPHALSGPALPALPHFTAHSPEPLPPEAPEAPAGNIVHSPMVGTFYTAPAPGKPPFVSLGETVSVGQVLCIVEAMKMLNQIESEYTGTVQAILVQNGEPVEYHQPLFIIT